MKDSYGSSMTGNKYLWHTKPAGRTCDCVFSGQNSSDIAAVVFLEMIAP
jgi:hypothetical protein